MQGKALYNRQDYDFAAVAKQLGLPPEKFDRSPSVDRMLRTGVSDVLSVNLSSTDGSVRLPTRARLALGNDAKGRPEIKIIGRAAGLKTEEYRGVELSPQQQRRLRDNENVLIEDKRSGKSYIARVDRDLNRIAGWSANAVMVPKQVDVKGKGTAAFSAEDVRALKRGERVGTTLAGRPFRAEIDPVNRKLVLRSGPKLSLENKQSTSPIPAPAPSRRRASRVRL